MSSAKELKEKWAPLVGRAILAFGDLEYFTLCCLEHVPRDPIVTATATMKASARIDLLLPILEQYDDPALMRLSEQLKRVKSLLPKRNLIAHNPLSFDIYEDMDGDVVMKEVIASSRKGKNRITLNELQGIVERAESLASEIAGSLGQAFVAISLRRKNA